MAKIKVWPGNARSRFANGRPKSVKSASAIGIGRASSWINRNSSSVYNTGSTNNISVKKPASLTSKIGASKVVTKRR